MLGECLPRVLSSSPSRDGVEVNIQYGEFPSDLYIHVYIYQKINVTNINIDHGMFRYVPYFCHFPMIHFKNKINRKWKSLKEEMT